MGKKHEQDTALVKSDLSTALFLLMGQNDSYQMIVADIAKKPQSFPK